MFLSPKGTNKSKVQLDAGVCDLPLFVYVPQCLHEYVQFKFSGAATASYWHRYYGGLFQIEISVDDIM